MNRLSAKPIVLCSLLVLVPAGLPAQVTEYFNQADFALEAPGLTLVDFDLEEPGDGRLTGFEYLDLGLTIVQMDGGPINVAQNLVPGGWGANYLTEANINSSPNAISSSIGQYTASGIPPDNFDFVFDPMVSAAGLFVGNLGTCENLPTTVQFLDDIDQVVAEATLGQDTAGVIFGTATGTECGDLSPVPFDSRIFYGVISAAAEIRTVRVLNGPYDTDGISIDDVQFGIPELTLEVAIDIKPGSDPNCFNINGSGVIPVAILGSGDFDVDEIDPYSLAFDGLAVRVRGNRGPLCSSEDSNGDGMMDLVCHFEDDPDYWTGGDDFGAVTGVLWDGTEFEGSDSICVVP